jgi:hypothetical protein
VGSVVAVAMVVVLLTVVVLGLTVVPVLIVITGMALAQQVDRHLVGPAPTRCTHS